MRRNMELDRNVGTYTPYRFSFSPIVGYRSLRQHEMLLSNKMVLKTVVRLFFLLIMRDIGVLLYIVNDCSIKL